MKKYDCNEELFKNNKSQMIVLDHVLKLVKVKSAVDVGCGLGRWGTELERRGAGNVLYIDGDWCNKEVLARHIDISRLVIHDMDNGVYKNENRFDLAVCLEVAEHVKLENERNVVETLVGLSDVVLFSAAIPGQKGQGHVNEQWPSHWQKLFAEYGYGFADVVRPVIWNNTDVYRWYRQNTFIVAKEELLPKIYAKYLKLGIRSQMLDVVHPKYYQKDYHEPVE